MREKAKSYAYKEYSQRRKKTIGVESPKKCKNLQVSPQNQKEISRAHYFVSCFFQAENKAAERSQAIQ